MEASITIGRVDEHDLPQMIAARIEYLTEMQGERTAEYLEKLQIELYRYFMESVRENRFFALKAACDGETVSYGGMILKKIPGDFNRSTYLEGEILNMYTVPRYRRRGISTLILRQLLAEARKLGVSKVSLHCTKAGEPLYRGEGFSDPQYPYLELILED